MKRRKYRVARNELRAAHEIGASDSIERAVSRAGVKGSAEWQVPHKHVLRESIVEDAVTGTHDRSAFASEVPGNADPRRPVVVVRLVQASGAGEAQSAGSWINRCELALFFLNNSVEIG